MTNWCVIRPTLVGYVDAPDRHTAEQLAARQFGLDAMVQSAVSYRIAADELATARRLLREEDGP